MQQHKQAQALYWTWAKEYPTASEDLVLEIWFHLANLYRADGDEEKLRANIYQALDFARQHMAVSIDRLFILQRQFQGDQELQDLLPEALRKDLARDLELASDRTRLVDGRSSEDKGNLDGSNEP
jgi:hypothetical protein